MSSIQTIPYFSADEEFDFPPVEQALIKPDGLLCLGGTLSEDNLVKAYQQGIFPWYSNGEPICWWSPAERALIDTNKVHVSKSLRKILIKQDFQVTFDQNFTRVIEACAATTDKRLETWITEEMKEAYIHLFYQSVAHSVEVWQDNCLVGGLYGVFVNNVFCGESMFSKMPNASKIALVYLAKLLSTKGCRIIDCQLMNTYLQSMGAVSVKREKFLQILQENKMQNKHLYKLDWGKIEWSY